MSPFKAVCAILMQVLSPSNSNPSKKFERDTLLIGAIPEFDSMAVVSIIQKLEQQFGLVIHDDEVSASVFESVETVVAFVEQKLITP